jgi:hypothetical protein
MRAVLAALLLTPCAALADGPEPVLDAVRLFNTTEVYRLEPSDVRAELRFASGAPGAEPTMEVRAEVGVTRHIQLNLAEDIAYAQGALQPSATPISLRYTLGSREDDLLFNPAVEVTVTPRPSAPVRAGLRFIVAEELVPRLVVAANGYVEQNVDRSSTAGVDGALGMTGGASYAVLPGHIRVGAEAQVGAAQYGLPGYTLALAGGPNASFSAGTFAATLSGLADLTRRRVGFEPMATLGCTF